MVSGASFTSQRRRTSDSLWRFWHAIWRMDFIGQNSPPEKI